MPEGTLDFDALYMAEIIRSFNSQISMFRKEYKSVWYEFLGIFLPEETAKSKPFASSRRRLKVLGSYGQCETVTSTRFRVVFRALCRGGALRIQNKIKDLVNLDDDLRTTPPKAMALKETEGSTRMTF